MSIVNNAPSGITASGFTLSMVVGGSPPPGSVMQIQWTTNPLTGPWVSSHPTGTYPPAVVGTFSHTFVGAPSATPIHWRGFVFTTGSPAVVHFQSPNETFNTLSASVAGPAAIPAVVSTLARTAATNAANAAAPTAREQAYIDSLISSIGPNPRRRLSWASVEVVNDVVVGLPIRVGSQLRIPAMTSNAIASADVSAGGGVHRVENAADSSVFIETVIGNAGSGLPGTLSANTVAGQPVTLSQALFNSPALNAVPITSVPGFTFSFPPSSPPPGTPMPGLLATLVSHMGNNSIDGVTLPGAPGGAAWTQGGVVMKGGDLRAASQPRWWGGNPRFDLNPTWWDQGMPWNWCWDLPGHQSGINARLNLRNQELWVFHDDTNMWSRIALRVGPAGSTYPKSAAGAGQTGTALGVEDLGSVLAVNGVEPDGSISIRANAGSVGNYHGYGSWGAIPRPGNVRAIASRLQARLIVHDPALTDQRHLARYAVTSGADAYPVQQGPGIFAPSQYNPGIGLSRWVPVINDWRWINMITLNTANEVLNDWATPTSSPPESWGVVGNFRQTIDQAWLAANLPPFS